MSDTILDSLPYYDIDLEQPSLRALVDAEIALELRRTPKLATDPRVPPDFRQFANNEFLAAELARIQKNEPLAALDTTRYSLPTPTDPNASEEDWSGALNNARSQLEHQSTRQINLALLQTYGPNAWKVHNYLLEADAVLVEKELERLRERVTDINRDRKNTQLHTGKLLTSLETRWTELVSNVIQIELANIALEAEVEQLRQQELTMEQS
ncbi:hypothetical protein BS47DRAFT_1349713 [Hydnum rufescens UP504]|uniref:Breast carcinoma amplified sequence 2 n=1 Tax=Hydnum rufescens UP504 TaxID=1448309 RepID=A0A9P6DS09_9AGAM|nr:hypothetical protein BS47DRAFT_1349713 [Hydnum rufescens UP504]